MKEINLEKILASHAPLNINKMGVVNAMREACRQTLELAAEKVKERKFKDGNVECFVDSKQSILDVINQVKYHERTICSIRNSVKT